MMNCPNCGTQLPQGANACPSCGSINPLFHASVGSTPNDATAMNSNRSAQTLEAAERTPLFPTGSGSSVSQQPPTYASSQPYYPTEPSPYDGSVSNSYSNSYASSPYNTDTPPPPPPPSRKRKNTVAFVVVLCVVLLALVGGGIFVFATKPSTANTSGSAQTTATPSQTSNHQTPPLEKQALYNHTIATTPLINDPLSAPDNYGIDNYTGDNGNTRCFFSQDALHSSAKKGDFSPCYAKATNYQNFVLQVKMTIISGHSGGLVFRADSTNDKGYQFRTSTDGTYILNRIILDQQENIISDGETLLSGSSAYIQQGTNQTNQLAVMARGDTISLFVNGKYIDSTTDNTYHSGQVGIYVDSDAGSVEGAFTSLQVWKLLG